MATIVNMEELPSGVTSRQFEGYLYGKAGISFFVNNTPPGKGPSLHKHPYEEIFIVQEGKLTFTVGDSTIEANTGQIVIVPPEVPHKFTNSSSGATHHIDIHVSPQMITVWLEE